MTRRELFDYLDEYIKHNMINFNTDNDTDSESLKRIFYHMVFIISHCNIMYERNIRCRINEIRNAIGRKGLENVLMERIFCQSSYYMSTYANYEESIGVQTIMKLMHCLYYTSQYVHTFDDYTPKNLKNPTYDKIKIACDELKQILNNKKSIYFHNYLYDWKEINRLLDVADKYMIENSAYSIPGISVYNLTLNYDNTYHA